MLYDPKQKKQSNKKTLNEKVFERLKRIKSNILSKDK
jgi:hypothetical protein